MADWKMRVGDIRKLGFGQWAKQNWKRLLVWVIVALAVVAVVVKVMPATKTYHTEYRSQRDPDTGYYSRVPVQVEDTPEYKEQHARDRDIESRRSSSMSNAGNSILQMVLNHIEEHWEADLTAFLVGVAVGIVFIKFRQPAFLLIVAIIMLSWGFFIPSPFNLPAWFIIGLIAAGIITRVIRGAAGPAAKPTTFGSAEWATVDHLSRQGLVGRDGYLLGYFDTAEGELPLHYTGDRHMMTIAPTRGGKGVSTIVPNLLSHKGSALIIDPKGENALITARQRRALGQIVHVVDPWGTTGEPVARFNPLDWLKADGPDIGENALMLADAMIVRAGNRDSTFWDEESLALLWGLILFVALDTHPNADRSLGGVRDIITLSNAGLDSVLAEMAQSDNHIVRSTASRTLGKDVAVRSSVLATLQSHTHFLDSPRLRDSLSESSFKFEDLKTQPMTVFLVLPADRLAPFNRWLRLLIQQAVTCNARNIKVKPARPILFMLDEMAALGKLSKVEEAFGLMAGFGMQMWGIVQDLGQLERIYGDGWQTFIGNSGVLQYFGSRDQKTAEYFSKLCGVTTIEKRSISRSITKAVNGSSSSEGWSEDVAQRQLAYPDELMIMRKGQQLLLVENSNPIQARKIVWYADARLQSLGVNLNAPPVAVPSRPSTSLPAGAL